MATLGPRDEELGIWILDGCGWSRGAGERTLERVVLDCCSSTGRRRGEWRSLGLESARVTAVLDTAVAAPPVAGGIAIESSTTVSAQPRLQVLGFEVAADRVVRLLLELQMLRLEESEVTDAVDTVRSGRLQTSHAEILWGDPGQHLEIGHKKKRKTHVCAVQVGSRSTIEAHQIYSHSLRFGKTVPGPRVWVESPSAERGKKEQT